MFLRIAVLFVALVSVFPLYAQTEATSATINPAQNNENAVNPTSQTVVPAAQTAPSVPTTQIVPSVPTTTNVPALQTVPVTPSVRTNVVPPKEDALVTYNQGRNLESAGKLAEAQKKYMKCVEICNRELLIDSSRMDSFVVKCWGLFRLARYQDVIKAGTTALALRFDARVVEAMGEAYFYLNDDANTIKSMQRYLENVGERGERVSTAYFYIAESYFRMKKYDHADIAYSMATYLEPGIARWWYRYGRTTELLGEYTRANDLYSKALKLNPSLNDAISGQQRVKQYL